jgi:hypothetical protein
VFCTNFAIIERAPQKNALGVLKDYLLQFYPKNHLLVLIRSCSGWEGLPSVQALPLAELDDVPGEVQLGATMYIPPLSNVILDEVFSARMSSVENLKSLYPDELKQPG